jgi:surface antigen
MAFRKTRTSAMKLLSAPLLIAAVLAAPLSAVAQGGDLLFLKNSPAAHFNSADFALMRGTVDKALAGAPEGPALEWKSDKTDAAGSVTPAGIDTAAAPRTCRKLRIANSYKFNKSEGVYTFCQNSTGKWALKP